MRKLPVIFTFSMLLLCEALHGTQSSYADRKATEAEIAEMVAAGTYESRLNRARLRGNHKPSPSLERWSSYKIKRASLEAAGLSPREINARLTGGRRMAFPFAANTELNSNPPNGVVNTLTILIDFSDYRADPDLQYMNPDSIFQHIYGTDANDQYVPYDSVSNYYYRASQGRVRLQGNVIGWHSFPGKRAEYEPREDELAEENRAIFEMAKDALRNYDEFHDYSQYDNDNDGDIDLLTIVYTGPDTGWNSFWWAYRWRFEIADASKILFDGKRLNQFVFQFVESRERDEQEAFNPTTVIHETGHAFGLPDYYDYSPGDGPQGGVGGLDMMDANVGNHNAFSRWLLDWIQPIVISSTEREDIRLAAASGEELTNKAIAIFPKLVSSNAPNQEMFIIENRFAIGNDADMPSSGFLIWHVDSSPNAINDDFKLDNSFTDPKLIRLIRADNPEDFRHEEWATNLTYFNVGDVFSPGSTPASVSHDGHETGIRIEFAEPSGERSLVTVELSETDEMVGRQGSATGSISAQERAWRPEVHSEESGLDVVALEQFARECQSFTPGQLGILFAEARTEYIEGGGASERAKLEVLASQWAAKAGSEALPVIQGLVSDTEHDKEMLANAFEAWAQSDPHAAWGWYFAADQIETHDATDIRIGREAVRILFRAKCFDDPVEAVRALDRLSRTDEVWWATEYILDSIEGGLIKEHAVDQPLSEISETNEIVGSYIKFRAAVETANSEVVEASVKSQLLEFMMRDLTTFQFKDPAM